MSKVKNDCHLFSWSLSNHRVSYNHWRLLELIDSLCCLSSHKFNPVHVTEYRVHFQASSLAHTLCQHWSCLSLSELRFPPSSLYTSTIHCRMSEVLHVLQLLCHKRTLDTSTDSQIITADVPFIVQHACSVYKRYEKSCQFNACFCTWLCIWLKIYYLNS